MSNYNYCSCGNKNPGSSRFCNKCGTSLGSVTSEKPVQRIDRQGTSTFVPFVPQNDDDDDDYSRYDHMQHLDIRINGLEVDLGPQRRPIQQEITAVIKEGAMQGARPPMPIKPSEVKIDNAQFLKDFAQEAGARQPRESVKRVNID